VGQRNAACAQADRARHRDKHKPCGCSTCSAAGTRPPPPRCSPSHPRRRHTHRPNAQVTSSEEMQIICTVPGAGQDGSRAAGTPRTNQPTRATMQGAMRTAPRMPACVPNERARAHPSLHALAAWPHGRQRSASTAGVHSEAGRSAPGAGELGKLPAQRLLPRGELLTHGARPSGGPAFCFEHPSHPPAPAPARCREPTRLPSGKPACRQAFVFFARHQRSKAHNRAPSAGGPHADQVPL